MAPSSESDSTVGMTEDVRRLSSLRRLRSVLTLVLELSDELVGWCEGVVSGAWLLMVGVGDVEAEAEGGTVETGHAWHVNSESESESSDTDKGHGVIVCAVLVVGTAIDKLVKWRMKMMSVTMVAAERDMGIEPSPEQDEGCDGCCRYGRHGHGGTMNGGTDAFL